MAKTNNPRKRKKLQQAASSADELKSAVASESSEDSSEPQKRKPPSSRPSVRSHRKVRPSQSGAFASGSISAPLGSESRQTSSGGDSALEDAGEASISGSIAFDQADGLYEGDPDDTIAQGALAAQAFVQEKQDEREQLKIRERARKRRRRIIKWSIGTLLFLIIAAAIAVVVVFSIFRWNTYDDHADMIGIWQVAGGQAQVTITEDTIELTEDVAYKYVIDPDSKTIQFTFGNLVGQGHYRFSLDRQELSIMDGDFDWGETLSEDIGWTIDALIEDTMDNTQKSPSGSENITELKKLSSLPEETQTDTAGEEG